MNAGKKLTGNEEAAIRAAKISAFTGRKAPTRRNYRRLWLKAKCLCAGREEFRAFSQKYSNKCLADAREIAVGIPLYDWKDNAKEQEFDQSIASLKISLRRGIRAYWNCNEDGRKELKGTVVDAINRLIGLLHHEDIELGKSLGVLCIKSSAFEEAEMLSLMLAEFGGDTDRARYEIYENCLERNGNLEAGLRMKLREMAIRIAPTNEEREKQLKKFQEECACAK